MKLLLTSLLFVCSVSAFGAPKNSKDWHPYGNYNEFFQEAALAEIPTVKLTKAEKRKPASVAFDESQLTPAFVQFRDSILAANTPDKLHKVLTDLDKPENFDKLAPEVKYFAAQVVLLIPMRSFVYRLRTIFEDADPIHSGSVTALRAVANTVGIYMPTSQWKTILDYVSVPSAKPDQQARGLDTNTQFADFTQVQHFMALDLEPALRKAIVRISPFAHQASAQPLLWDSKLTYGAGDFRDNPERIREHQRPEVNMVLAGLNYAIHRNSVFCAYNQHDLLKVLEKQSKKAGIDAILTGKDLGVSKKDNLNFLTAAGGNQFPRFLTLYEATNKNGIGHKFMNNAGVYLKNALGNYSAAWKYINEQNLSSDTVRENVNTVLNPVMLQAGFDQTEKEIAALERIMNAKEKIPVESLITGEIAYVNMPNLFSNPPKDIKEMLPTAWDEGPSFKRDIVSNGKVLEYRNYYRGRATGWNNNVWMPYVSPKSGNMADAIRAVRQAWGGDMIANPLSFAF